MAQLCRHWHEFEAARARAVIITFGAAPFARAWLAETGAPFAMLLDPGKAAYHAFGLERSLARSWSPKAIWAYVRLLSMGRRWRGIQGDSGQLGGNFVVDSGGIVRFVHRSHDPTDRPDIGRLLDVFRRLPARPQTGGRHS